MDPKVKEYLMNKFDLGNYSDEARQKLEEDTAPGVMDGVSTMLGAISAGFGGRDPVQAALSVSKASRDRQNQALNDFDKARANKIQEYSLNREFSKDADNDDLNSAMTMNKRQLAQRMSPTTDFSKMSGTQIDQLLPSVQKLYELDQKQLDRQEARDERRALFGLKQQERQDAKDLKKEEKDLSLAVPGYERTGEVLPKTEEAQKFRKATAVSEQLKTKLNRMKELVKEHGSFEYGGSGGQEMESLATEIQLLGKSPELYELGVLAGPDLNLLQKITSDPTSMSSFFTQDSTRQKQLDSQLKSIDDKLSSTAKSMGYRSAGQKAPTPKVVVQNGNRFEVYPEGTSKFLGPVSSTAGR